ncbi:hypothetical protein KKF84_20125 [Myxococcota bacterium]|nr:hypothetical protein [Myxococcota bacterium]
MCEAEKEKSFNLLFLLLPLIWGAVGIYIAASPSNYSPYGLLFLLVAALQFFSILTLTTANNKKKLKDWQRMLLTVFMAFMAVPNLLWLTFIPMSAMAQITNGLALILYPLLLFVVSLFVAWRIMKGRQWSRNLLILFGLFFLVGLLGLASFTLFTHKNGTMLTRASLMGLALMLYSLLPSVYLMARPNNHHA